MDLKNILKQKVLPAVNIESSEHALPIAEALLKGGLNVMEIQFRTEHAAQAIELIRKNYPEMNIGAGTLLSVDQLKNAIKAGAQFGLSPSLNKTICEEAKQLNLPFIPGIMTPSEIEFAHESGCSILKLFPAAQLGGVAFLKAMLGPYEQLDVQFIPMGGVTINNLKEYVQMKNVIAVGGSWLVTKELQSTKNYIAIYNNVVAALKLIQEMD
ncbi:MAG: bifunctional 4-hydroxy-2-oxoglutarate aldolase/2-dehydro-3-deoxy-phosphogluconate aldolase [Parafilimonas sp.]|nr:bifunctional 4-hydroxy-2-oxoglutarate aldolase/2-dehydro-3-deoxy-phosphogluconate aldolase [Parafilimonas sp.]